MFDARFMFHMLANGFLSLILAVLHAGINHILKLPLYIGECKNWKD